MPAAPQGHAWGWNFRAHAFTGGGEADSILVQAGGMILTISVTQALDNSMAGYRSGACASPLDYRSSDMNQKINDHDPWTQFLHRPGQDWTGLDWTQTLSSAMMFA